MTEFYNFNPGLVPNDKDGTSCSLACGQMLMRTKLGGQVLSFEELDRILHRKPGDYSWEYGMLSYFATNGFEIRVISLFDFERFCLNPTDYMVEYFGEEAATDQVTHTNLVQAVEDTKLFLTTGAVGREKRMPTLADVRSLMNDGFYLIPYVNQRILQADPGYVAHTVFLYGFSARGVRMHNPGPPATEASEIAWDFFEKAWSSPSADARILFAGKPLTSSASVIYRQ